jgi:hypothetical protein
MKNLDQTLALMAEKLGTKAELLWPQLVAIQRFEWFVTLAVMLVFGALAACMYFWYNKRITKDKYDDASVPIGIAGVVCALFAVVAIVVLISNIPSQLIYPEIGALQSLTQHVR